MGLEDPDSLAKQLRVGNRRALARAITLMESTRKDHRPMATQLLKQLMPHTGRSIRLGISGVPGVGKSTFIETFGNHIIDCGHRLAVLAVDPSSALSGGSILGDKTRMELLSRRSEAFIRPSPTGKTLGGVTRRTRETMLACEAAGFDVIIVETVGVGQSEVAVAEMTDMFLLMLLPGGGDELQGIKRGIVELADLILVNKADGSMAPVANNSAADYRNALQFLHPRSARWRVQVSTCSALEGKGVKEVWKTVEKYRSVMTEASEMHTRRASQARAWMWSATAEELLRELKEHPGVQQRMQYLEESVAAGLLPASVVAQELVDLFKSRDLEEEIQ